MALLAGTNDGVYRCSKPRSDEATRVLDAGRVMRVRQFARSERLFACSKTGLFCSTDGGETWSGLGVPREEVYSVVLGPEEESLYAGTHPAHLYVSDDGGDSWRELDALQDVPSRDEWYTPRHRDEAHVRSLGVHPDTPDRVVAGVEVGGVHLGEDRGESWVERREGVHDDVHHVLVVGPEEYVASCGGGLYRTEDAGRSWVRLDDDLSHRYFREAIAHDGRLYAAAAREPPGTWSGESGADGGLFVSDDGGESFSSVSYPGQPDEVVLAWAVDDGRVVAGTNEGRVIVNGGGTWETAGQISTEIRSLSVV
ncbi:MAG: WD40/YVTN/BNR-like repeat-containing protein [Haloferacaceae archaeon]